jgi:hypothetical protein
MHEALDRGASPGLLTELQAHLRDCAACAREYEALAQWDGVLRAPDADEPGDGYFDRLARRIGSAVGEREARPAPRLMPSWGLAWGFAAACLLVGLALGHLAFPRTVTETKTVAQAVPGPVRTVTVEKIVEKPVPVRVEVPVVRWRTRTVVREVAARPTEGREALSFVVDGLAPAATPAMRVAETLDAAAPAPARGGVYFAVASRRPSSDTGLTRTEMRALAVRLTTDVTELDRALNSPHLAATLVSNLDDASAELRKTMYPAALEAPR